MKRLEEHQIKAVVRGMGIDMNAARGEKVLKSLRYQN